MVATKLNITDFATWINQELNGYKEDDDIPEYRIVKGNMKAYTPNDIIEPLHVENIKLAKQLSTRIINDPVSEIISYSKDKKAKYLVITYPVDVKYKLIKKMKHTSGIKNFNTEPVFQVEYATFARILDTVRTKVLEYALKLEQEGIIGTCISFSTEEKQKASKITYNITNNIGNMHNSQLQQSSAPANQTYNGNLNIDEIKSLIKKIQNVKEDFDLRDKERAQFNSETASLEKQINSNSPKDNIISEILTSMRNILEGITSNTASTYIINLIARII